MKNRSRTSSMIMAGFFIGFGLGSLWLHHAAAQGVRGLSTSVSQISSAQVEKQRNIDDLQKNMGTVNRSKNN